VDVQFLADVIVVGFDRARANEEVLCYLSGGLAIGDQRENSKFSNRKSKPDRSALAVSACRTRLTR
jgi:hypothetical protein